jgi:lipopolysaccharide/colanic/teichoic acid biosynthesis glycosyltransferase
MRQSTPREGLMRRLRLLLVDCVLTGLAGIIALLLRENFEPTLARLAALTPYLLLTMAGTAIVFPAFGISRTIWRFTVLKDYVRLLAATVIAIVAAVAFAFGYNRLEEVARAVPVLQALLMIVFMIGVRVLMRLRHAARAKPAQLVATPRPSAAAETVLVVGLSRLTELYLRSVAEFAPERVRIAGLLVHNPEHTGRVVNQYEVLGTPDQVAATIRDLEAHGVAVNRIVVTTAFDRLPEAERTALLSVEQSSGIRLEFIAERLGLHASPDSAGASQPAVSDPVAFSISDAELASMARRPYWKIKRALDFVGAVVLLLATAPLMLFAGVLVVLDVGWPIVFWQQRPGLGGRQFRLYKLRTMSAAHDAEGRPVPERLRASRVGRVLRRLRIDELPQLLNILVGEMSFIGPRPLLPADQSAAYAARLLVRPGLTGWAQVKAGRKVSPADKAALDVWYVKSASLTLDVAILIQTARMVILGERINDSAIRSAWHDLRRAGICASNKWENEAARARASAHIGAA